MTEMDFVISFPTVSWDSSVGIATRYGWTARGSSTVGSYIFHSLSDRPWGPPSVLYNGYRVVFREYNGRGVALITHPL
jgi:hypothetical protein